MEVGALFVVECWFFYELLGLHCTLKAPGQATWYGLHTLAPHPFFSANAPGHSRGTQSSVTG